MPETPKNGPRISSSAVSEACGDTRIPDNDPRGDWSSSDLTARNYYSAGTYEVTSPTGRKFRPSVGNYFRVSSEKFNELDRTGPHLVGSERQ